METVLLIDGENIKGKIKTVFKEAGKNRPVWHQYDFKGLFDRVLSGTSIKRKIFYFARIKEHENSIEKSRQLNEEQRLLKNHLEQQGFEVVLSGRVRGFEEVQGGKQVLVFKEKGVDVTERHLIMQSLFSRADSGLLKDEASPTMPGNIMDKFISK